ncbi:TonB-dependent receptor plug domain-containing protein [Sphingomonas sp. BAUL-RG-20F-R05-02]|uniref:TonB-dependent receptor plug domain-containing protein n=1 Tax=Sphingomonas sp. BAUL-RG-20F-R05-02 TaxID=2914830 RepID=UPI001F57C1D1|nr:TonB-dependent receptor plug domain-containing protein [Sphingomonas sp. BAUL-RG-20F-R05-02]
MRLPLIALGLVAPALAAAQAVDPATGDIVVLGRGLDLPPGTPAYGSVVIDRKRLANDASGRVEDVLLDVAGFQQFRRSDSRSSNPSNQGATLRALGGNASSRTLVLLDGVPIADPFFGYIPFSALVPDRLAGIRVTRGGGSGPFGAGAVAGTIEMTSAGRADLPVLSGQALYGSRDAQQVSATLAPSVGGGFVALSGQFERGDGFQTTPEDQRTPATVPARYRDWSTGLRAVAPIGPETEVQFRGLVFGDNRTLRFKGADSASSGEDASVRLVSRGDWQVDALAYVQARNFANKVISSSTFKLTLDQRNTPSTGIGGKIELRPPVGGTHVLRIGGDFRLADGQLFEDAYSAAGVVTARRNAGGNTSVAGLFAEDDWTLGRLVLTGGARVDRWTITDGFFRQRSTAGVLTTNTLYPDRDGTEATGRAGALLKLGSVDLRVAGYTGFRLPTLNELYRPFTVFPVTTQANANLAPERLRGVEGGIDAHPLPGVTLSLTGFYNRLEDAIANLTITTNLRMRGNVNAIVAKGLEATGDWKLGAVDLSASYAFSDSKVDAPGMAFDGLTPAQSPRHTASGTLAWAPRSGFLASLTARYVGKQYEDDLQTDVLRAATTLDAFVKVPVHKAVAVIARAENLFDATVVTRNQAGSMDLGTPRTLWIGVRFGG